MMSGQDLPRPHRRAPPNYTTHRCNPTCQWCKPVACASRNEAGSLGELGASGQKPQALSLSFTGTQLLPAKVSAGGESPSVGRLDGPFTMAGAGETLDDATVARTPPKSPASPKPTASRQPQEIVVRANKNRPSKPAVALATFPVSGPYHAPSQTNLPLLWSAKATDHPQRLNLGSELYLTPEPSRK